MRTRALPIAKSLRLLSFDKLDFELAAAGQSITAITQSPGLLVSTNLYTSPVVDIVFTTCFAVNLTRKLTTGLIFY